MTTVLEPGTSARGIGASVPRVEDHRFLTGAAEYIGNVRLPSMLEIAFLRSPVAHGEIRSIDLADALKSDGIVDAVTSEELDGMCKPIRADAADESWQGSEQWPLAKERVRFVGEPVAAVVGTDRYVAEDAAEMIMLDIDPEPAVASIEAALAPDAPLLHDGWRSNLFVEIHVEGGDVERALREADHTLTVRCSMGRQAAVPLETRGCVAHYDPSDKQLTLWLAHQMPHMARTAIADVLGFPEHRLRLISPDVGGAFGVKSQLYPEEIVACLLAMRLGRPVRWIEDRWENLVSAAQARDHHHTLEVGYRDDGVITAVSLTAYVDSGAYSLYPGSAVVEPSVVASLLPGPYRIEHYRADAYAVCTNKCPGGPYRGIARVPACFTIERAIDQVARRLGLGATEVRRRNMVRADEFPYTTITGNVYDSGSFIESLDYLESAARLDELRTWQGEQQATGRLIGLGVACFIEQTAHGVAEYARRNAPLIFGFETAILRIDASGRATVLSGVHSHGQGHETTLAQVAVDQLGLDLPDVRVVLGDTDACPYGHGTFASRTAVLAGGAVHLAAAELRSKLTEAAAYVLDDDSSSMSVADGRIFSESNPSKSITVAELARIFHLRPDRLPPGMEPSLEARVTYMPEPGRGTYSNGAHLAMVEVDAETGRVEVLRYVAVDDCGRMINPLIVEGQIHGGVAQGIGAALLEEAAYDDSGTPLATTLADYSLPGMSDIPDIETLHLETPSPATINGVKGTGESGAIPSPAAICAAVEDALRPHGDVFVARTPLTPEVVRGLVLEARSNRKGGEASG
jgi:aerobic carbon-monoxide dehydrogenase large subunit